MTEPTPAPQPPMTDSIRRHRWRRMIGTGTCYAAGLLVLAGILVRLTVKDSLPATRIFFYAAPVAVLMAGAACCTLCNFWRQKTGVAIVWCLVTLLMVAWWIQHDWRRSSPPTSSTAPPQRLKVLFWNVARRADLAPTAKYIRSIDPDIVGLVEGGGDHEERRRFWQQALPGYDISVLGGQMYLLSKGPTGETNSTQLQQGTDSISRNMPISIHGRECEVFVVDIDAHPEVARAPSLRTLSELAEKFSDRPVLLMGDFNTPPDSVGFLPLRQHHQLAFEAAGTGYAPTWPVPVPVLQLDQIWVNSRFKPLSCRHGMSWNSDHRPVIAEFDLAP